MAFKRQVKNFVKNYSDAEIKVREATSNDPWGPSSSLMLAISDLTFNTISLSEIMNMLWQRLNDHGKNWRHVYKSLMLMDYLIKNGSKEVSQLCRERFCHLQMLKDFQHIDEAGKDQGYYIREKSKQVIALLVDEQLLHKEREVACRTRRCSSYSVTFSKRLPGTGNSPASWASDSTPEVSASEKKHKLLKVARLHKRKNTSKAESKQQPWQDLPLPGEPVLTQETLPLRSNAWKSTEDLMLFYEDDPKPLLPTVSPAFTHLLHHCQKGERKSVTTGMQSQNPEMVKPRALQQVLHLDQQRVLETRQAKGRSSYEDALRTPSEKKPYLQTNASLDKKSDSAFTKTVTENPSQMPLEKQSAAKSFEALTTSPAFWSSSKEESVSPNVRISTSDSTFCNEASVETLYISPSFKMFDPVKEAVINKDSQKSTRPSITQTEDEDLKVLTTWVSTTSEVTSSFSTLSMSSPDPATPEKSAPLLPPILARPSSWTLSRPQSSPVAFTDKDKPAQARHPFVPRGPASSDEEMDNFIPLEVLPDNSGSAKKKTSPVSNSNWAEFSTPNVDHFPCSSAQTTAGLPGEPEANSSIQALLGEVKSAIVKLHEDLSLVIQELGVINSRLVSMGGDSLPTSPAVLCLLPSEGGSEGGSERGSEQGSEQI